MIDQVSEWLTGRFIEVYEKRLPLRTYTHADIMIRANGDAKSVALVCISCSAHVPVVTAGKSVLLLFRIARKHDRISELADTNTRIFISWHKATLMLTSSAGCSSCSRGMPSDLDKLLCSTERTRRICSELWAYPTALRPSADWTRAHECSSVCCRVWTYVQQRYANN